MFRPLAALLFAALAAAPAAAQQVGDRLGLTIGEVASALEAQGHVVRDADLERDHIEVETRRDGVEWDIEVSRETGRVIRVERD